MPFPRVRESIITERSRPDTHLSSLAPRPVTVHCPAMKYFNLAALSALLLLHASSASACMKASITYSPATRTLVSATLWDNGIEICHLAIGRPPSNPNAVDLECIAVDGARWTARGMFSSLISPLEVTATDTVQWTMPKGSHPLLSLMGRSPSNFF